MSAAIDALKKVLAEEQGKLTNYNLEQTRRVEAVEQGAAVLRIQTEHVQSLTQAIAVLETHAAQQAAVPE